MYGILKHRVKLTPSGIFSDDYNKIKETQAIIFAKARGNILKEKHQLSSDHFSNSMYFIFLISEINKKFLNDFEILFDDFDSALLAFELEEF